MIVNFENKNMDIQYYQQYIAELNQKSGKDSERTHYPALDQLIEKSRIGINLIVEERGNKIGIPDFTVRINNTSNLIGYIEAKKIGENLDKIEKSDQLKRYFDSSIGQNLILTNFLEFRLYRDGNSQPYLNSILAIFKDNKISLNEDQEITKTTQLINSFINYQEKSINNYVDLAQQMAIYTKSAKYAIEEALNDEQVKIFLAFIFPNFFNKLALLILTKYLICNYKLTELKLSFRDSLIPDLDNNSFADMYAQTIAYGLFVARIEDPSSLQKSFVDQESEEESIYISNKIPFLKELFDTVIKTNVIPEIYWAITNLRKVFAQVDITHIIENFGQEIGIKENIFKKDPVFHFYESFLANYSADLRKSRGVYYTPEPVVSFMVKAVNDILDQDFRLQDGLGNREVTVLDPATGTGTFLYQVIQQIHDNFLKYGVDQWDLLFKDRKVLERLFGFELLMTPYTIANLKLQLCLEKLKYIFTENQRLNIFLTNTLDEGIKKSEFLLSEYIAQEANSAAEVKKNTLIHVVIGNPPYSGHSANKNDWIDGLMRDYYKIDGVPLDEKNPKWLQDDYVKFIRFGEDQIEKNGLGILAFITNHGYLDNPTFRGMRQHLMQSFSRIFLINLHGNIKKKEISPDGNKDENVFNIQQGVSILIAIKDISEAHLKFFRKLNSHYQIPEKGIYYYDLWGSRAKKYDDLNKLTMANIPWQKVNPISPFYLFIPQNNDLREEYNSYYKITDIMPINSVGIVTARDSLTIQNSPEDVETIITDFVSLSEEKAREKYNLGKDTRDWQVLLAQKDIKDNGINKDLIKPILYRPFDLKYTYYTGKSRGFLCMPRNEVMRNILRGDNLVLITVRKAPPNSNCNYFFATNYIVSNGSIRSDNQSIDTIFPLYIYPNTENGQNSLITEKKANFSPSFLNVIKEKLGYIPSAEKIFYYIYAIFYSPTYRERYAEFLKIDFPRIPLTKNDNLFTHLATKGAELVNLHLMKSEKLANLINNYQGDHNIEIKQITYNNSQKIIVINKNAYFTNIDEAVWEFKIGGYQILDKWLKDRKKANLKLASDDLIYYQKIIVIVKETIKIMTEIDQIISQFPLL